MMAISQCSSTRGGAVSLALVLVAGCGGDGGAATVGDTSAAVTSPGTNDATVTGHDDGGTTHGSDAGTTDADSGGHVDDGGTTDGGGPIDACGVVETFADGLEPTTEIHVALDGEDGGGCGSAASPCASLDGALAGAAPGTAIRIHAGTYPGGAYVSGLAGSEDAPIWIGGAPGEDRPVFEGGDVAMHLSGVHWLVLHDLEVRNMQLDGINVDDGGATADPDATRGLVVRGLYIHDIGTGGNNDCLKLSGVNDFAVLDSEFARCGGGSGSAIDHVGCHHGTIAFSRFHDLQASGNAVQTKGGSEDLEIYANTFDHAGERAVNMGGSTGFEYFRPPLDPAAINAEARDIRVVANLFVGSFSPVALVGCTGCLVAHNTVLEPEHWVLRILQETTSSGEFTFAPSGDNRVIDNLVVFSRAQVGTVVNIGPDTAPETFEFAANLWFASDEPAQSDPGLPVAEHDGIVGVDPRIGADGAIGPDSPAAGAGVEIEGLRGDRLGRCWGTPPSIGAHEIEE